MEKNDINQNSVLFGQQELNFLVNKYGYRRGHSTVDQIISFCQSISDAQNCKPTHHTMAALPSRILASRKRLTEFAAAQATN
ncbi:hypothetical protein TNCV_1699941 [Trichonephila clavipes]|nr:hypothetical protein TNCV_1699941 [Trichonephila clavipes]